MPSLNNLACSIELSAPERIKLGEYHTRYTDGGVSTYIAVPDIALPFHLVASIHDNNTPGFAFSLFIDGQLQCMQIYDNRSGVPTGGEVFLRQKEERLADSVYIARTWSFTELKQAKANDAGSPGTSFADHVGTIELVVLRCQPSGSPTATKPNAMIDAYPPRRPIQALPAPRERKFASLKRIEERIPNRVYSIHSRSGVAAADPLPTVQVNAPRGPPNMSPAAPPGSIAGSGKAPSGDLFGGLAGLFDGAGDEPDETVYLKLLRPATMKREEPEPAAHAAVSSISPLSDSDWSDSDDGSYLSARSSIETLQECAELSAVPQVDGPYDNGMYFVPVGAAPPQNGQGQAGPPQVGMQHQAAPGPIFVGHSIPPQVVYGAYAPQAAAPPHPQYYYAHPTTAPQGFDNGQPAAAQWGGQGPVVPDNVNRHGIVLSNALNNGRPSGPVFEAPGDHTWEQPKRHLSMPPSNLAGRSKSKAPLPANSGFWGVQPDSNGAQAAPENGAARGPNNRMSRPPSVNDWGKSQGGNSKNGGDWGADANKELGNDGSGDGRDAKDQNGNHQWEKDNGGDKSKKSGKQADWGNNTDLSNNAAGWGDNKDFNNAAAGWGVNKNSNNNDANWGGNDNNDNGNNNNNNNSGGWNEGSKKSDAGDNRSVGSVSVFSRKTAPAKDIKSYWQGIPNVGCSTAKDARDPYIWPAPPPPFLTANTRKEVTHGVQLSRGCDYMKIEQEAIMLDSMERPHAVFTFKYRSQQVLEKKLGRSIDDECKKIARAAEQARLGAMGKQELVNEVLKLRLGDKK